jgi:hypothetical protein
MMQAYAAVSVQLITRSSLGPCRGVVCTHALQSLDGMCIKHLVASVGRGVFLGLGRNPCHGAVLS